MPNRGYSMSSSIDRTFSGSYIDSPSPSRQNQVLDITKADEAYLLATENPKECHVEVGILRPDRTVCTLEPRLGKNEPYGAHRVGSVTKTFTTLLALKLSRDGLIKLSTKCGELIDREILESVFQNPGMAAEMTLEQLLSHTAGLEYDDHNRQEPGLNLDTLQARFIHEGKFGSKYKHTSQPGDGIGSYSNAGFAVAAWMLEVAYNKKLESGQPIVPFSQIMKDELFKKVFYLSEASRIAPGPGGDVIGAGLGDMTSSVEDLLKVAQCLQHGEAHLAHHFGKDWHNTMLAPRDLFEHHGLGCAAKSHSIQHAGLNCELIDGKLHDVTALVIFPLGEEDPGLVAMCDSNALGPLQRQQEFASELKKLAGIATEEHTREPIYELDFFCPNTESTQVFMGDAYIVTDVDPFSTIPPEKILCSRNGMKHELRREPSIDSKDAIGYLDTNGKKWMMISKGERKLIYSEYCLVRSTEIHDLAQPSREKLKTIEGVYHDSVDDLTYSFTERGGRLYFREGRDGEYPALYLPQEDFWVVSLPEGRKNIKFRFPNDLKSEPLIIVDISKEIQDSTIPITDSEKQPPRGAYKN